MLCDKSFYILINSATSLSGVLLLSPLLVGVKPYNAQTGTTLHIFDDIDLTSCGLPDVTYPHQAQEAQKGHKDVVRVQQWQ